MTNYIGRLYSGDSRPLAPPHAIRGGADGHRALQAIPASGAGVGSHASLSAMPLGDQRHLGDTSATLRLHLGDTLATLRLHLGDISAPSRGQVHAIVSWVSGEEPSGDQAGQQQAGQQQPPSSGGAAQPLPGLQGLRLPAVKLPPRPAGLSLGRVGRRQAASIRGQHGASPDGSAYSPSGGSDLAV
uniref:Uncharacterized protein n=1 Tax=Emiliania huxleyi TaxID=2903 RepID=A0A7S3WPX3_EMIHU